MNNIIEKLTLLERETRKLHRELYAVQELRLDFLVDFVLLKLELRTDIEADLDLDLTEAQIIVFNNEIGSANAEIAQIALQIETNTDMIENL